jgi:glycerol-3-phosphate acyltransferase PlsY
MILIWKSIASFLIGSIPFAKIAMLGTGIDITKVGSKNPGFRNVSRVASKWRALVTLVGDIGKGYVALLLLGRGETSSAALWIIGIAAVIGHCWSPFLGFCGGKGVATTVGVLLRREPLITIVCLPLYWLLRFIGSRLHWSQEGAIASLTTMFVMSNVVLAARGLEAGFFAYIMLAIVVFRHGPNLREIMGSKHESPSAGQKPRSADVQAAPNQSQ